jgi:hypothetical protein
MTLFLLNKVNALAHVKIPCLWYWMREEIRILLCGNQYVKFYPNIFLKTMPMFITNNAAYLSVTERFAERERERERERLTRA